MLSVCLLHYVPNIQWAYAVLMMSFVASRDVQHFSVFSYKEQDFR